MRRFFSVLLLLLASQILTVVPLRAAPKQHNVVLIVADDLGLQLGCYGDPVIKTPGIDVLAAGGTRYDRAFCTTSSCSPSRSVILSGLQNHTNGLYGLQHATHKQESYPWVKGMPNLLHDAGYRTCSIGKYHVGPESSYHFDAYENDGIMASRNSVRMAENAERWIRSDDGKPFFLYFCFTDPHRAGKNFANDKVYPGVKEVSYDPKTVPVPSFLPDWPEVHEDLAQYYRSISRMDQGVGRLMQALQATGHADDTLVIFISDNGMPFPGAKCGMYEPSIRLPLVVRSPEQKTRGSACHAMVSWADLLPTVLEWTGAKGPSYALQGRSFLSTLDTPDPTGWDEIYASHQFHEITMYYPMRTIRTRKWKYILNLASDLPVPFAEDLYGSETWQAVLQRKPAMYGNRPLEQALRHPRHELFDLENDPNELHNLAGDPKYASVLKELQGKLKAWQERTKDPWLVKYIHE